MRSLPLCFLTILVLAAFATMAEGQYRGKAAGGNRLAALGATVNYLLSKTLDIPQKKRNKIIQRIQNRAAEASPQDLSSASPLPAGDTSGQGKIVHSEKIGVLLSSSLLFWNYRYGRLRCLRG